VHPGPVGVHTPEAQVVAPEHARPQTPQFALSVARFAHHEPPSAVPPSAVQSVWLVRHTGPTLWQSPPTQRPAQGAPQAPQFRLSLSRAAQYGAPLGGLHRESPPPHVTAQVPPLHTWPAGHVVPHAPQFWLSVPSAAQYAAPASGVHNDCPAPHVVPHCPLAHTVPTPQARLHAPQFALSLSRAAQYGAPPSGWHRERPPPQLVSHAPHAHTMPALHTLPQAPQLARSVPVPTHSRCPPSVAAHAVSPCWHESTQPLAAQTYPA
jgi:hypothetical protein